MSRIRTVGTVAAVIGAAVSLFLLLNAGKNTPLFLLIMFVGWVALPFVTVIAGIVWDRLSDRMHSAFEFTSIANTLGSIGCYIYFTINPLETTPARTWLITPGVALIVIAAVFLFVRPRTGQKGANS